MTVVHLRLITVHNWKECAGLTLHERQRGFVPGNLYSIAEAQFYPEAQTRAIYNESDEMVGFVLYGRDVFSGKWKIFRLMIDAAQQRRGYGRAAMAASIAEIVSQANADTILICYQDANDAARQLYASFGFREQSIDDRGKVTAVLKLSV